MLLLSEIKEDEQRAKKPKPRHRGSNEKLGALEPPSRARWESKSPISISSGFYRKESSQQAFFLLALLGGRGDVGALD